MDKLKVDLHIHTREDPRDIISYSAFELIDRAQDLGFDALAVTGHDQVIDDRKITAYAERRDILMIPGMEATLSGKHVLLLNPGFRTNPKGRSLVDLPRIKSDDNLVMAPHPFFPQSKSLKSEFLRYADCFDAVEFSHFYHKLLNFNRRAQEAARACGLPLVGTSDSHYLFEFGTTYSLVEARKDPAAIIAAVKSGRVEIRSRPLSLATMARVILLSMGMKFRMRIGSK